MPRYAIFDLDNCLANDLPRIPLIDWSQEDPDKRYAAYHEKCGEDDAGNLNIYRRVTATHTPIFLTARPVAVQLQTRAWISRWLGVSHSILMMRNNGDRRPSVDVKRWQLDQLTSHYNIALEDIKVAYDDRQDIVDMYNGFGIQGTLMSIHDQCACTKPEAAQAPAPGLVTAADILQEMADTFRERNKIYGNNFRRVGPVMQALHPDGVTLASAADHELFHLWSLLIVKASRFAVSGLKHQDSLHDLCVYGAIIESILKERESNLTNQEKG